MTILTIVPFVAGCLVILIFWGAMILLPDNRYDKMFGCLCCLFSVAQPAVFTVLNYAFLLSIFAICELVSGLVPEKYAVLISFLNPVLVIFSWYVAEKLIEEVIFVEPMKKSEKHVGYLGAIVAAAFYALLSCWQQKNIYYINLFALTMVVFIGSYVPITDYFCDGNMKGIKERLRDIVRVFSDDGMTRNKWISVAAAILVVFLSMTARHTGSIHVDCKCFFIGIAVGGLISLGLTQVLMKNRHKKKTLLFIDRKFQKQSRFVRKL